jgi:hypothetical protein
MAKKKANSKYSLGISALSPVFESKAGVEYPFTPVPEEFMNRYSGGELLKLKESLGDPTLTDQEAVRISLDIDLLAELLVDCRCWEKGEMDEPQKCR